MTASLKKFEDWAIPEGFDCTKSDKTEVGDVNTAPGKYLYRTTQDAYRVWTAALATVSLAPARFTASAYRD